MPTAPKKPCRFPGCSILVSNKRYCDKHRKKQNDARAKRSGTSTQRGYGYKWQQARKRFLQENPLCKRCADDGMLTPAIVVDHITPHKGDQNLFWDQANWQPLCKRCHDRKTAAEDGAFGC